MFGNKPKCSICEKDIKGNDVIYVKMRYPMYKGSTEKTAFLRNETIICEDWL